MHVPTLPFPRIDESNSHLEDFAHVFVNTDLQKVQHRHHAGETKLLRLNQ